jgi:hypothetical protein
MSRRISMLSVLAVGLVAAACTDDGIMDPALMDAAQPQAQVVAADHAQGMVPITWRYHMTAAPGDMLDCSNSDGSPSFLSFPVNWKSTGSMTHLGVTDPQATRAWFTSCTVEIVGGYPVSGSGDGFVHVVGANGDAVDIEGTLTLSFTENVATGAWTITGGTGRFRGASGWVNTYEVPAEDGSGSVGSGSGMITRPGSFGH